MYRILIAVITSTLLMGCAQKGQPPKEVNSGKSVPNQNAQNQIPAAKPQEAAPLAVIPSIPQESSESIMADELIIEQGKWGYSVYDPKMGVIEYFTGSGSLLGSQRTIYLPGSSEQTG